MSCSSLSDSCGNIQANPDISGIGVRVAIYMQTFISMFLCTWLPKHSEAFRKTSRNSYVVSTSLIIATLISWQTKGLILFDGLIVTMLTTIMTAFVTTNGPYIQTLGLSINLSSFLFTTFWCYWGLQIWSDPWNFGLQREDCITNQGTIFVVFGHNVSATSRGLRGFAIFFFSLGSIAALFALGRTLLWLLRYIIGDPSIAKQNAMYLFVKRKRRENRANPVKPYGGLIGLIYMIVTTEQMVARNTSVKNDLANWTFGQTLALIMLAQPILDCFEYAKQYSEQLNQNRKDQRPVAHP